MECNRGMDSVNRIRANGRSTSWVKKIGHNIHEEKKNKSDWVPDPLYEAVEKAMPHESELTIEANRYVESDLMPIFASGMPVDIVQEQHTNKWNADIQDSG